MASAALGRALISVAYCTIAGSVDESSKLTRPLAEFDHFDHLLHWLQDDFGFVSGRDVLGRLWKEGMELEVVSDESDWSLLLENVERCVGSPDLEAPMIDIDLVIVQNPPPADDASGHTTDTTISSSEAPSPKPAARRLSEMFADSSEHDVMTESELDRLYGKAFPNFPALLSDAEFSKGLDEVEEAYQDDAELIRHAIKLLHLADTMNRRDVLLHRLYQMCDKSKDKGKGKAPESRPVKKPTKAATDANQSIKRPMVTRKPIGKSTRIPVTRAAAAGPSGTVAAPVKKAPAKACKAKSTVDMKKALAVKVEGAKTVDANYDKDDSLDAPLGSYNTGDSMEEWSECLDFFCLDVNDYLSRTEGFGGAPPKVGTGPRKRAGMKKLFGMTVSLFDYQLMGVFRLIKQVTRDCHGGFLADACGIGKTVEMLGVLSTASALRRMLAEVKVAASGATFDNTRHLAPGAPDHAKCPSEKKYGVRCPCHFALSRKIVAMLPEGPNLMLTPTKTASQLYQEAKNQLDASKFQVRLEGSLSQKEDRLRNSEIELSRGTVVQLPGSDIDTPLWSYSPATGTDNLVVVVPYPELTDVQHAFDKLTPSRMPCGTLVPGIVFADEFHEVSHPQDLVMEWLRNQTLCAKDQLRPPAIYFTSATPIESSPKDLAGPLSVLEKAVWSDSRVPHAMEVATSEELTRLDAAFRTLVEEQAKGGVLSRDDILAYRTRLDRLLDTVMVRRLATDTFRGRSITDLGPMSVTIQHCAIPEKYKADVQALSDLAMREARNAVTDGIATSVAGLVASGEGATIPALAALRVVATFPAMAAPLRIDPSLLSDATISRELRVAGGDIRKTAFWQHIAIWTRNSPKLASVLKIAQTMAADNTPIEGESTRAKKLCIFTPTDAEAMLIYAFLQQARGAASPNTCTSLRPVWLHPAVLSSEDATLLDTVVKPFKEFGHHGPNVLVASMARAGTGLDFPQAKYCVVTGPGLRKSDTTQVFGRCHRVRQKQRTQLHLLVSRGNPMDRRLYDGQRGVAVPTNEEAWAVAVEGETIPGNDDSASSASGSDDVKRFVANANVAVNF